MGAPPSEAGPSNVTPIEFGAATATRLVGAPGRSVTVTDEDGAEAREVPLALVAVTENVYVVPATRSVTVHDVDTVMHVAPVGLEVTV